MPRFDLGAAGFGPPLLAVLIVAASFLVLLRLDALTPPAVRSFRIQAAQRGLTLRRPWTERVARRFPFFSRFRLSIDLGHALKLIGSSESSTGFMIKVTVEALILLIAVLVVDELGSLAGVSHDLVPRWLGPLLGALIVILGYVSVLGKLRKLRTDLDVGMGDMFGALALLAGSTRIRVDSLVLLLSEFQEDGAVFNLLREDLQGRARWESIVRDYFQQRVDPPVDLRTKLSSAAGVYDAIGEVYDTRRLRDLATAMRQIGDANPDAHKELIGLASNAAENRLSEAELAVAKAAVLVKLPVALLLIPLFILLIVPTIARVTGAF